MKRSFWTDLGGSAERVEGGVWLKIVSHFFGLKKEEFEGHEEGRVGYEGHTCTVRMDLESEPANDGPT
jgi:hypothetical protein